AWSIPSKARSSTYCPRPRRKRMSSMRSIGLPMSALVARTGIISDHNANVRIAQRARDAQSGQSGGFRVAARRLARKRDREPSRRAFALNLVHVAGGIGVRNQLDLCLLEAETGERDRGRDVRILRIKQRSLPCVSGVEHCWLGELVEVHNFF